MAQLLGALVTGLGTPVPGLPGDLTHVFPCAQTVASASLAAIGFPAADATAAKSLAAALADLGLTSPGTTAGPAWWAERLACIASLAGHGPAWPVQRRGHGRR